MSRDLEHMERHVDALFTRDVAGRLVRVREHDGAPAPRFFLGRTANGSTVRRYRADVDDATRGALDAAVDAGAAGGGATDPEAAAPDELARYSAILAEAAPIQQREAGPAFRFPREFRAPYPADVAQSDVGADAVVLVTAANLALLRPLLAAWVPDVHRSPPLVVYVGDGRAVAVCASVRITPVAHEAGVETDPAFRGRGYASRVVAAWARAVRALGAEPLYSTTWENTASRAVARTLGLVAFGHDLHLT